MNSLADWLAHCAAMHPKTMDLSLERTVQVARTLGIQFEVPVIGWFLVSLVNFHGMLFG